MVVSVTLRLSRTLFPSAWRARRIPCLFQPQRRRNGLNQSGIVLRAKDPQTSKRRSSRRQVDTRTSVLFFPDVHDQLVKTWSAPQSAHVHSATQAMFSQVDGAEAHRYELLKDSDRKVLLNAPITPSGLFGDSIESIIERFAESQKHAKAMSRVMPRHSFQLSSCSRSSSATHPPQRREERPAAATAAKAPRREPDVWRKVWPGPGKRRQGQRRSPHRDTAARPAKRRSVIRFWCCLRLTHACYTCSPFTPETLQH